MNQVSVIGNITKELELKHTPSGAAVVSFDIAVPKRKKEDGANFLKVVAWNKTAEYLDIYCGKGSKIAVSGRLDQRTYTDKDGKKVYVVEIVADTIDFLSTKLDKQDEQPKSEPWNGTKAEDPLQNDYAAPDIDDDDLPF